MEINQKEPWHRDPDSGTDNEAVSPWPHEKGIIELICSTKFSGPI